MRHHYLSLVRSKNAHLEQYLITHGNLADVVKRAGEADGVHDILRAPELPRYGKRVLGDPVGMVLCVGVPGVKGVYERIYRADYAGEDILREGQVLKLQRSLGSE